MGEFFTEIVNPANILATVLMGLVLLYWILVIIGALGMDAIDIDFDVDADAELDFHFSEGFLGSLFSFLHIGQVPVMVLASFFALFFWVTTISSNHAWNPEFNMLIATAFVIPCAAISLLASKFCVMPLAKVFRDDNPKWNREKMIGLTAKVNTLELTDKHGEIVFERGGAPVVLSARNHRGQTLRRGDVVRVVGHDRDRDVCLVELVKMESK